METQSRPRMDTAGTLADPESAAAYALLPDCSPRSPYRALDWRWRLASFVAAGGRPPRRKWIDASVIRAVRYLDWIEGRRRRRPRGFAVTEDAHRVHTALDRTLSGEIELRLLSGQACGDVAAGCGLPSNVVEAYSLLFFDVTEMLKKCDYIGCRVFGRAYVMTNPLPLDLCLKIVGYNLGTIVVPYLVDFLREPALLDRLENGDVTSDGRIRRSLRRLITIISQPVNDETALGILRVNAMIKALDRSSTSRPVRPVTVMPDAGDRLLAEAFERAERAENRRADEVTASDPDPDVIGWSGLCERANGALDDGIETHRATG
jgi:hypothetical protein